MDNLIKIRKLIQNELGSINLDDIAELKVEGLTPEESKSRAVDVEIFYKNIFKKVIKLFVQQQLEFIGIGKMDKKGNVIGVTNDIELSFARGTLNGICLIKDWFEEEEREALARHEPKEEPSNEPFPEV